MLVRVRSREFTAELIILKGFCTSADEPLAFCIGCSAAWIKGHFIYRKWRAVIVPDKPRYVPSARSQSRPIQQLGLPLD